LGQCQTEVGWSHVRLIRSIPHRIESNYQSGFNLDLVKFKLNWNIPNQFGLVKMNIILNPIYFIGFEMDPRLDVEKSNPWAPIT